MEESMKRHSRMLLFSLLWATAASFSLAADGVAPGLVPGTYKAVTESEWHLELKLEQDGGAIYTFSSWEPGKASTTTKSNSVRGRWSRDGNVVTMSFSGADSGKTVVYELTECLSYQLFGLTGCSSGLKPVKNTMSRSYSQPVWNSSAFNPPDFH
jgi:hypothetical protein